MKTKLLFSTLIIFLASFFSFSFAKTSQADGCNPTPGVDSYCRDSGVADCGTHFNSYDASCGPDSWCCSDPPAGIFPSSSSSSTSTSTGTGASPATVSGGITIPDVGLPDPPDTTGKGPLLDVLLFFMQWILIVFVILAVISFVITGIQYFFALGDKYSAENAKNNFKYSVIAVLVTGISLIIILTIDNILSGGPF